MDDEAKARALVQRRPLQHLEVTVRVARGEDGPAADEAFEILNAPTTMRNRESAEITVIYYNNITYTNIICCLCLRKAIYLILKWETSVVRMPT